MRPSRLLFTFALLLAACGGTSESTNGADDVSDDELRTAAGISEITVTQSSTFPGFAPPSATCRDAGRFTVDLTAERLKADACIDREQYDVDRALSADEIARVKDAIAAIKIVPRPELCPRDAPERSVQVKKGSSTKRYVGARTACSGDGTAADTDTIEAVVTLVRELTKAEPASAR